MRRNENGITLIALIITIIILVILAAVSIRSVYNMGIVNHAVNGTAEYVEQSQKEEKMMQDTASFLDETIAGLKSTDYSSTILAALQGSVYYNVWNVEVISGCKPLGPSFTEASTIYYLYNGDIYKAVYVYNYDDSTDTETCTWSSVIKTSLDASTLGYNTSTSKLTTINGTYTPDDEVSDGYWLYDIDGWDYKYDSAGVFLYRIALSSRGLSSRAGRRSLVLTSDIQIENFKMCKTITIENLDEKESNIELEGRAPPARTKYLEN